MKKILSLVVSVLLIANVLVGCANNSKNSASSSGDDAANEVKVGLNYEMTGAVASFGQNTVDGINMAFEEINAAGGVNGLDLVAVTVDNKSDSSEATSVATRLMTQEGVVACLGPVTSGNYMATIPVATDNKIPVISGSSTIDVGATVNADGSVNEYVFRTCFSDSFQGLVVANFANGELNAKKAVIIQDNSSDYAKGLAKTFKENFDGEVVAEEGYVTNDKDFNAILTKIKSTDFDVIFIPGYYQEAGLIIKQARGLGIDAPILGADGFDSPVLLELAGAEALNNVYFSNHYSPLDKDPKVQKFIADYKAKYGAEPSALAALGYDAAYFLADAMNRAGTSTDSEAIKNALAETKDFAGVTGTFTVGPDHNTIKSAVMIGLENGVQTTSVTVEP
ncbi:MAG: ABC transporter substrate-binding protein [Sedimentibacter sp.]